MLRRGDGALIGRTTETTILDRAMAEVARGQKRAVVLSGQPGMGKTTLLYWSHENAVHSGFLCGLARAPEAAVIRPGFPIQQLVVEFSKAMSDRHAEEPRQELDEDHLHGGNEETEELVSLSALISCLSRAGKRAPLAVFLDDLQWISQEPMEVIRSALRLVEAPLLFVGSTRSDLRKEATVLTQEFMSEVPTDFVELGGLTLASVAELASGLLQGPILPSLSRELQERTLGNPLFVAETVRAWKTAGDIGVSSGGYWGVTTPGFRPDSRSLLEMISARLRDLESAASQIATIVATLGRPTTHGEVAGVLKLKKGDLTRALGELDEAGIITRRPDGNFSLTHPMFEAAIRGGVNETRLAALHEQIFAVLKTRGAPAGELAYHAIRSLQKPPQIAELLRSAAQAAENVGSYREASDWFARLVEEARDDVTRDLALAGQAAATVHFDAEKAIDVYGRAISHVTGQDAHAELLLGRARALRLVGRPQEALVDLRLAAEVAATSEKTTEIRSTMAVVQAAVGDMSAAPHHLEEIARETQGTREYPKAVSRLAMLAYQQGDLKKARELSVIAESESRDSIERRHLRTNLAWFLLLLGEWQDCESIVVELMEETRRANDLVLLPPITTTAACLALWRGQIEEALDFAGQALRLTTENYLMDRVAAIGLIGAAFIEKEDPSEALKTLEQVPPLVDASSEKYEVHPALIALGESHLLLGELSQAIAISSLVHEILVHNNVYEAPLKRLDAQLALAAGDAAVAIDVSNEALSLPVEIRFEVGRLLEVRAEAQRRLGHRSDAAASYQLAYETYVGLGAGLRARRVQSKLSQIQRRKSGRPILRDSHGLTAREAEILSLISVGRTNKEIASSLFISEGTVKKHLDNIRAKVQIQRRSQLIAFAQDVYGDQIRHSVRDSDSVRDAAE